MNTQATHPYSSISSAFIPARTEPKKLLGFLAFMLVLLTVLFDINAATYLLMGTTSIGSPLILAACILAYIGFQFRFATSLGRCGIYLVVFYLVYLVFGSVIRLTKFSDLTVYQTAYFLKMYGASVVIMLATALGSRYVVLAHSFKYLVAIAFSILILQVFAVFSGQVLGASMYSSNIDESSKKILESGRAFGLFANPNTTGMAMAMTIAIGFSLLIETKRLRVVVAACMALALIATVLTYSRSSVFAVIVLMFAQIPISPLVKSKSVAALSLMGLGITIWFVLGGYKTTMDLNKHQADRMASFGQIVAGDVSDENTGSRFVVAAHGLKYWMKSPIFGHGIGEGRRVTLGMRAGEGLGPHNTFISVLIDSGIPGILAFGTALVSIVYAGWRTKHPGIRTLVLGVWVVYICDCMVSHNVVENNLSAALMGMAFGAMAAASQLDKKTRLSKRIVQPAPMFAS